MKNSAGSRLRSSARLSLMALVGWALAGGAAAVRGQSALDGFDPNANGVVNAVVVQPDGKILLGGDFTTLSPNGGATVTRNHIARLNPDGPLTDNCPTLLRRGLRGNRLDTRSGRRITCGWRQS